MKNFNDGGFKKGGRDFGGGSKFGGGRSGGGNRGGGSFSSKRDGGGRSGEMFPATCSECRKSCEVPFRPSSDKPVFCSACFGMKGGNEARSERGGDGRDNRNERPDYTKLPRDQRPPRHDKTRGQGDNELGEIKKQLAVIESRLNRILDLINPPTIAEETTAPVVGKVKAVVEKAVVKKATKKVAAKKTVKKTVVKKATKKVTKKAKK